MELRNRKKNCCNGACIDTGTQITLIGLAKARAYCKFLGIPFALSITKLVVVFGVDNRNSIGILHMRLQTPNGSFIMLEVYVVPTNVPMLLGLDVLDKFGLCADTVHDVLHCTAEDWNLPLVRKLGHVYLEWSATHRIIYTKSEMQKLHRNFSQPSMQNLIALLKRAKLATWLRAREQFLAISKMLVAPAIATVRNHAASNLNFSAKRNYCSVVSSRWTRCSLTAKSWFILSIQQHDSKQQLFSIRIQSRTDKARTAYGMLLSTYGTPSIQDTQTVFV
jgi:hypothetical protein